MTTSKPSAAANAAVEWDIVSEGIRTNISFDTPGEEFTGYYEGHETVLLEKLDPNTGEPMTWESYLFEAQGVAGVDDGEKCAIAASVMLAKALEKLTPGTLTKIVYVREIPSADKGRNATKDFKIYSRR